MLDPAVQLHFSNSFIKIIENSNILYKVGLFWKLGAASDVKKALWTLQFYHKNSKAYFQ